MKIYIFSIGILTLTSCLSTKELIGGESILGNSISELNGEYENVEARVSDNYKSEQSLYILLFKSYDNYNPYYNKDKYYEGKIRIKEISDKKIQVDYIVEDNIKKTKILTGEIKNNFFVVKRKWRIFGIPIFFGVYDESKIALGLNKDKLLYVRKGFYNAGGVIGLMANSNESYENYYYKPIRGVTGVSIILHDIQPKN